MARCLLAQQLLEDTDEDIDQIARQAGFGNATAFRHHFRTTLRPTVGHSARAPDQPADLGVTAG